MNWVTLQDTPIILSPNQLATDSGWTISEGVAYHGACFPGVFILKNIDVQEDTTYIINYEIKRYTSGVVYPIIGGVNGTSESSLGKKQATIVVPADATDLTVQFYSDGDVGLSYMNTYALVEDQDNAITLGFNADKLRWTTNYSWHPQMLLKFVNSLFTWYQGRLFKMNSNETRNFFYDTQYYSEIEIIFNIEPQEVKNLFSMRVNSNVAWEVTDIYIRPIVGKQAGQRSRIKKNNFVNLNGQFSAEFLRNMLDPMQLTELEALFKGDPLQGTTAKITLRSTEDTEVRLVSIDILGSRQDFNY